MQRSEHLKNSLHKESQVSGSPESIRTGERRKIMNAAETKERITTEFITKYYEWLRDLKDLPEREYGYKYFYGKPKTEMKDNQKALIYFNTKVFKGRWEQGWIKKRTDMIPTYY